MNRQYGVRGAVRALAIAGAVYLSGCSAPEVRETEHVKLERAGKTPAVTFDVLGNINRYIEKQEEVGSLHVRETNKEENQIDTLLREETSVKNYLQSRVRAIKRAINPTYREPDVAAIDRELQQTEAALAQVPGAQPQAPEPAQPTHDPLFNGRYAGLTEKQRKLVELRQEIKTLLGVHEGLVEGLGSYGKEAKRRLETYLRETATEWQGWTDKTDALERLIQESQTPAQPQQPAAPAQEPAPAQPEQPVQPVQPEPQAPVQPETPAQPSDQNEHQTSEVPVNEGQAETKLTDESVERIGETELIGPVQSVEPVPVQTSENQATPTQLPVEPEQVVQPHVEPVPVQPEIVPPIQLVQPEQSQFPVQPEQPTVQPSSFVNEATVGETTNISPQSPGFWGWIWGTEPTKPEEPKAPEKHVDEEQGIVPPKQEDENQ